jgi:hypothetical protein
VVSQAPTELTGQLAQQGHVVYLALKAQQVQLVLLVAEVQPDSKVMLVIQVVQLVQPDPGAPLACRVQPV